MALTYSELVRRTIPGGSDGSVIIEVQGKVTFDSSYAGSGGEDLNMRVLGLDDVDFMMCQSLDGRYSIVPALATDQLGVYVNSTGSEGSGNYSAVTAYFIAKQYK